jgi:hypothetical protein
MSRSAEPEQHTRRRHAGGSHRGPDEDLLVQTGAILLFILLFGGFFAAVIAITGL